MITAQAVVVSCVQPYFGDVLMFPRISPTRSFIVFRFRIKFIFTTLFSESFHTTVGSTNRSRPNWIADPRPKAGSARNSESHGPENCVSRWQQPNSDIYLQNNHLCLVYDIYQFLGMEAQNYKFGMFCQQSVWYKTEFGSQNFGYQNW